jgi:hypothetical protein
MAMARHQALLAEQQQRMFQQQQQLALGSGSAGKHSSTNLSLRRAVVSCDYALSCIA